MALNHRAFEFPGREEGDRRSRDVVHGDVARATQHRLDVTPWPGQCPGALASLRGGRASCRPSDKARTLSRDVGTRQLLLQVMFHILDIIYILYHSNIIIYTVYIILSLLFLSRYTKPQGTPLARSRWSAPPNDSPHVPG